MHDFIQAIADEHVYLFDGAMGTMLYSKGVFINKCYDELNLRNPEIVLEVHKQYVRAGAEILETNTYGANRIKLRSFGIEDELRAINERGAAAGARSRRRFRLRRRRDRSARHPHRAVRPDVARRGARVLPRAGRGAARWRRRSLRARDDVRTSPRSSRASPPSATSARCRSSRR